MNRWINEFSGHLSSPSTVLWTLKALNKMLNGWHVVFKILNIWFSERLVCMVSIVDIAIATVFRVCTTNLM